MNGSTLGRKIWRKCRYIGLWKVRLIICCLTMALFEWWHSNTSSSVEFNETRLRGGKEFVMKQSHEKMENSTKLGGNSLTVIPDTMFVPPSSTLSPEAACTPKSHRFFPLCEEKYSYLKAYAKEDKCLRDFHLIDESTCSIYHYLTYIEPYCASDERTLYETRHMPYATPRSDQQDLLHILRDDIFHWMRNRVEFIWPSWRAAGKRFSLKKGKYRVKNVVVYMGAMQLERQFLDFAGKGGPLGELVQWTDLLTGIYVLGHNITFSRNVSELSLLIRGNKNDCATGKAVEMVDVIYLDLTGLWYLNDFFGSSSIAKYKCMFRVLDSFGTDPQFNSPVLPGGSSRYGYWNLQPEQFLTLYPHSQDNNFLGFAVHSGHTHDKTGVRKKRNVALIYAKSSSYFKTKLRYIEVVSQYFEVHTTCNDAPRILPSFIHNHGPVSPSEVQRLLAMAKVFIGVGFPFEGPGPLEAMAVGTVFLQPKFDNPVNRLNSNFFKSKPTLRELTSQSPYMEERVGEPYCYTINVTDESLLRSVLVKIKSNKGLEDKIPHEFTSEGMMERLYAYTSRMDFCDPHAERWPPLDNLQILFGEAGASCKDACMKQGLICERTYFDTINLAAFIELHGRVKCTESKVENVLHAPSFDWSIGVCYLQNHAQLFSCMRREPGVQRLCPCRDYEFEQVAICKNCL